MPARRHRLIAVGVVLALVVAVWWWRGHGDDPASEANTAHSDPAAPARAEGPERVSARPRRDLDDAFGAQYRGAATGPVRIEGRVIDGRSGEPVAGVDVILRGEAGEATATSGGDGGYAIEVASGRYELRAAGELVYGPVRPLMVGRVAGVLRADVPVTRLVRVRGRVVDAAGAPVAGAKVTVYPPFHGRAAVADGVATATTTTGGDGGFEVIAIPGDVQIDAEADAGHGTALVAKVEPGETRDGAEVRLAPFARLAGVVRTAAGAAVPGATVQAWLVVARTPVRQRLFVETDAAGAFAFDRMYQGHVFVEAKHDGLGRSPAWRADLAPGARHDDLVLVLEGLHTLAGRVVDDTGQPVADAKVKIEGRHTRLQVKPARTDGSGWFAFDELIAGDYILSVEKPGHASVTLEPVPAPSADVELVLAASGAIRGTVTGPDGAPVSQFEVKVTRMIPLGATAPGKAPPPLRFAADDGRYEWRSLAPGRYDLTFTAPGLAPATLTGVEVQPAEVADASVALATVAPTAPR